MRSLITLALSLGVAAAAPAQTQGEIIIRRPGVPDRVIKLDSARVTDELVKLQDNLKLLTATSKLRSSELSARLKELQNRELPSKVQLNIDGLRNKTLALREGSLASRDLIAPLMRDIELKMRRPLLGITVAVEPRETDKYGAYIEAVTPGSPAAKAGILAGDIVIRLAGKSVLEKDPKDATAGSSPGMRLIEIISTLTAGKPVDVELRRGTQNVNLKVTPAEDTSSGAIARLSPSISEITRLPTDRIAESPIFRNWTLPDGNMLPNAALAFRNGFEVAFDNNGLFANIELTSLNEKLGSYFGATEGVLVVNVGAPRDMVMMRTAPAAAGRGGVMIRTDSAARKAQSDSARKAQGAGAGGRGGAGAVSPAVPRITVRGGRTDTTLDYYVEPGSTFARRAPVNIPVEPGDVIVSVDGRKVTSPSQLMRIVRSYDHNDEFKLQIVRQKRNETLTIKMP